MAGLDVVHQLSKGFPPSSRQDRDLGSDPLRAGFHTQAPDTVVLGLPPRSQVDAGHDRTGLPAIVSDQAGLSSLTAGIRPTSGGATGQHSAGIFPPGVGREPTRDQTHHPTCHPTATQPATKAVTKAATQPATTHDTTHNNVGQGNTGALPPDQLSFFLHALGPYLGIQHPLPGLQEDAFPHPAGGLAT